MAQQLSSLFLTRLVLPLSLGACAVLRQNLFSFVYLVLLLCVPLVKTPTMKTMAGATGRFLMVVMVISVLTTVAQISFQIVLFSMPPYGHFLDNCELLEKILRHIGLVKLDHLEVYTGVRMMSPEVIMLVSSITIYILCSKVTKERRPSHLSDVSTPSTAAILPQVSSSLVHKKHLGFLVSLGKYLTVVSLCVAGAIRPSIPGAVYFLVFLGAMTWWACYKELGRAFAVVLRCTLGVVTLHILALFAVQVQWVQESLPSGDCNYCRYLGLTVLVTRNCTNPVEEHFAEADWDSYVNPVFLLWLFYILVIESRLLLRPRTSKPGRFHKADSFNGPLSRQISVRLSQRRMARSSTQRWRSATRRVRADYRDEVGPHCLDENTRLIRAMSPQQSKYTTGDPSRSPSSIHQDAHGSVTITDGYEDVIQLHALGTQGDGLPPTGLCDKLLDCVLALFQFISRSSYVATSITMMAWSITYHSWLTFVLLLWASVLWIVPNQRRSMLRCSPFLVFYSLFLLLSQYIYSMDLTEAELPQKVEGFNLKQIGFVKALYLPIRPILVKSLYTIMFWTTLRQFMQERFEQRSSSTLEDMVAPLQITVGTATRGFSMSSEPQPSPFMTKLGACLQAFFTKFWIWVVAIMLFGISFVGTRMTVLRIIYMALFLVFILTFQVSYQFWRKMMYAFWLTVILYSMSILVLIYTYQFDNFPEYWEVYLGVPKNIQQDLGLETYQTGDLFVRLLSPAFFLVITVIQLHYYHKDFLAISDIKSRSMSAGRASQGSNNYKSEGSAGPQGAEPDDPTDVPVNVLPSLRTLKHVTKAELVQLMAELKSRLSAVIELFWCFLELHLIKIMMLSVILMCVYDVCALHLLLVVLVVAAMSFGRNVLMVVTHIVSVLISLLLLTNMIYQIDFFKHDEYNVNCTDTHLVPSPPEERPLNDADWVGLQKTSKIRTLPDLLKGYIGLIVLATILAVVDIRQMYRRHMDGACLMRPTVIFPQIQRVHTDDNIKSCLMFLFNYGFYKFGVEVSLVMTVILIGSRMDVYAVLYGLWLCILFALKRETIARFWGFFQLFIIIVIPIQYAMAVGLPPGLCIEYPWYETDLLRRLQEWMYLPDPLHSPPSYKLLCDFILLAFVCRQSVVFRIERRYSNSQDYPGGSNRDITKECEEPGFINPVPDFITFTRSWLDVVKRVVFQVSLWVTLGLVFLAGTNRVNVFSLGYLVGTFVFLWQGEEMYLIPVQVIVRRWNVLLGYNVGVIMLKTALQIVGCVFIKEAQTHACWVVQLLGIGCIKKFGDITAKLGIAAPTECNIPRDHVGLAWDGVCFAALILMRRLFRSYYFIRLVDETKAMTVLASRGAELIEELRLSRIMEQQEQERQILEKIKMKMERIKATQQKIQGALFKEPDNHFVAIRSGDYYMFEELDDVDLDEEKDVPDSDVLDSTESKRVTLSKFLSTAMKTDMEQAADLALAQPQPRSRTSTIAGVTTTSDLQAAPRRSSVPLPPPRRQSSSFSTAQTRVTPPSPSLHSDYQLEPSPAESKDSYESVEGRRVKPGDHKAPDHSPPSSDPGSVSELDRPTKPPDEETNVWTKIWMYIKFIWAFLESAMVTITKYLNRNSRDYRYVVRMLALEKKMLKEDSDFGKGTRNGPSMVWQPLPSLLDHNKLISRNSAAAEGDSSDSSQQLEVDLATMKTPRLDQAQARSSPVHSSEDLLAAPVGSINRLTEESQGVPEIRLVAPSLERGLDSGSGVLVDESDSDSQHELSAADQPPVVQLCIAIYYSLMSHSELICYFMVFLHQIKSATILSLPLPLMVFLWGTLTVPRPTKTFWVTLIAYTETIVVVKCLFQFDLIPWNIRPILDNQPFFPPRIIGIEQKPNYATYDLALLLIIFFHRVMLKSMGLWKSSYEDPIRFPKKEEMFALDSSGSDEQQTKAGEEFSDLQPSKLCLRRGSAGSKSSSVRQVVTQGGRRLSAIRSVEDLEGETSTDLPTTQLVVVETERESALVHFPAIIKLATVRYFDSIRKFFENLMVPSSRVTADVYTYMFLCDFFNFLVVVVGIESFGTQQGDGGVTAYLEENKVPIPFLLMLILQFALIVIDRALYLRKHILGKIVFQFLLVVGIHIWMFFILPGITERQFNAALPPQMWYMVKSFYLLLSAYQIRCGYPTRILGNVLCKRYNILNYVLFKGYLLVPFLFELRTIMDWVWTNTTMTLMDWLKMEDIFNNIFQHKCARRMESEYPQPRGERKNPTVKYLMGGGALVVIIGILWFPLVLFALGNTVGKPNLPYDVTLSLRIGPYQPVYTMSAQNNSIYRLSDQQWTKMANAYKSDRVAQTFLSGYDSEDVGVVALGGNSTSVWGISPPDMDRLILEVASANPIVFKLAWKVSRASNNPEVSGVTEETREWVMEAVDSAGNRNPQREVLANMLGRVNSSTTKAIIVQDVLPKFVKVTNRNTVPAVKQLMGEDGENEVSAYRNLSIRLYHDSKELWWELKEAGCDNPVPSFLKTLPFFSGCKQLVIYTFNEKAFPAGLSIISGGGIIGLYTTLVLIASNVIRGNFTGICNTIMFDDMPNVDRILQLCLDIYLVRESGEFALEEDLFAKLVFLYRSPETLIKWSRPPEEGEEEADGERPAIAQ